MARLSDRELSAWRSFLEAHAVVVHALEQELATEQDLPLASYDVLVQLSEAPGDRLRMRDLADAVLLSRSGLTRLVDRLEREGLVRREPSDDDRRGADAVLTPAGRARLRAAWPVQERGIAEHFAAHLSAEEVDVLRQALGRIVDEGRQAER
jgi:DNA-binding MarR family transcriptional regulator